MKRWQYWVYLVLGVWMLASPWALGFADTQSAAAWSAWVLGAALLVLAGIVGSIPKAWEEGTEIVLGVCLLGCPWALDFAMQSTPTSNALIAGVLTGGVALWVLLTDATVREWLSQRHQTNKTSSDK